MERDARFWSRIAQRYSRTVVSDQNAYTTKLSMTRDCFTPDTEVLEVGCGTGSTALLHAPYVRHIHATDFSEAMIAIAMQRASTTTLSNISFEVRAAEESQDLESRYDVVLALNLLHLVDDLDLTLRSITAVLKEGGTLVASTACLRDSLPLLRFVLPVARWLRLVPQLRFFSEDQLMKAYARVGLVVTQRYRPEGSRSAAVFHMTQIAQTVSRA